MFKGFGSDGRELNRALRWLWISGLAILAFAVPASAQMTSANSPTLSVSNQLDDRRYVTTGDRGYIIGTEDGRFPAIGFHTRGEMRGLEPPDQALRWHLVRDRRRLARPRHTLH